MTVRNHREIEGITLIGKIVGKVLAELRLSVQPGISTKQIDSICGKLLKKYGAMAAPKREYGFPGNLCISVNDEVVHGIPSSRIILPGDLVKLDLEAEKDGYIADATVCVGVAPISKELARLISCAEQSFWKAIRVAKAGTKVREIGRAIEREVRIHGFRVVRQLAGHGVGRACHEWPEIPNYAASSANDILSSGLVITIEPIITCGIDKIFRESDGWTVRTSDRSISAHFEHTLMITDKKPIVLTAV